MSESNMKHYLLCYDVVDNYVERRAPYRAEHLQLARESLERGELLLGGAVAESSAEGTRGDVDGAVLWFQAETSETVERFVAADPYVRQGLITRWRIRQWITVIGAGATNPS